MAQNIRSNFMADFDHILETPTRKQFFKKARYSNGGVIVSKADRNTLQKLKVITISNDVLKDSIGTPSTVHRLGSQPDQYSLTLGTTLDRKASPILRQTISLESLIQSVGSSPKEAEKRAIHHELFRTPLQVTSLLTGEKPGDRHALQHLSALGQKRKGSSIERSIKDEVTKMRQQLAKFPNSKPEMKHYPTYPTGQPRPRPEPVSNQKQYTKRKKAAELNIDLTQLANLDQRRGGGCAAGNLNAAQF